MLYQPLTKTQEEKYRSFCQAKDDRAGLTHIDVEEMARAGETVHDPVAIPKVEVNTERFNTVNLQAEIAKGMQQIMDATEKMCIRDSPDCVRVRRAKDMRSSMQLKKLRQGHWIRHWMWNSFTDRKEALQLL